MSEGQGGGKGGLWNAQEASTLHELDDALGIGDECMERLDAQHAASRQRTERKEEVHDDGRLGDAGDALLVGLWEPERDHKTRFWAG